MVSANEIRCPYCEKKYGQVNEFGNVIARVSKNGRGVPGEMFFLKGENIKIRCCERMTIYNYDGYTVTATSLFEFS